jgi:hypothetical protein
MCVSKLDALIIECGLIVEINCINKKTIKDNANMMYDTSKIEFYGL